MTTIIKSFSKREMIEFGKFLKSPYFNENQDIITLYEQVYDWITSWKEDRPELTKQDIWKIIYGNTPYKDIQLRRLTSDMTKLAEQYLVTKDLKKYPEFEKVVLLKGLKNRKLSAHFNSVVAKDKIGSVGKSTDYHFEALQVEVLEHEQMDMVKPQENTLENLAAADFHLDCYYWIKKLRFYCSLLSYKIVKEIDIELNVNHDFIKDLPNNAVYAAPAVQVYYKTALLLEGVNTEDVFDKLRDLLIQYEEEFPLYELKQIYFYLQNFCAREINTGKSEYLEKLFNVYKTLIERGILPGQENLKQGVYKNILTLGLIVKEFDWVKDFIRNYTDKLPKEHQENALNYNLAKVYFHQERYEQVIEQLQEVEYKNLVYALGGKLMLMKTYFELKEQRPLYSLIESFRIYLRRNKLISKNVRQQYMNSLRFTKKLANLAPYDVKGLERVKEQVMKCKALAAKKWLLEKIAEMEK